MSKRQFLIPSLLLAGFLPTPSDASDMRLKLVTADDPSPAVTDDARQLFRTPPAIELARHRSHSSHRSHRSHSSHSSHRSSTGGSSIYRPAPIYVPPPTPRVAPRPSPAPVFTPAPTPSTDSRSTDYPPSGAVSQSTEGPSTLYGGSSAEEDPFTAKVKQVQRGLKAYGYYDGEIDGVVGPKTKAALEWFQSYFALKVTGTITPEVLKALEITN